MRVIHTFLAAALACAAFTTAAEAQSLSGNIGNKRYSTQFHGDTSKNPCKKAFDAYVKAGGHSAYAQTPAGYFAYAEATFCGIALNAKSEEAAKQGAIANCKRTGQKYKVKTVGRCEIYYSK